MTDILPGIKDADRPSAHGAALGQALARIAAAGDPDAAMCSTCAFREGSLPNQMAGTVIVALNTMVDIDKADFACHHGLKDGEPQRLCAGYIAARLAPFRFTAAAIKEAKRLMEELRDGPDEVRAKFDAWVDTLTGPVADVYELGRLYAKREQS